MEKGEKKKAEEKITASKGSKKFKPGPEYYLESFNIDRASDIEEWKRLHNFFCEVKEEVSNLPMKKVYRLAKYKVTPGNIGTTIENLEKRLLEQLCNSGTIADLNVLYRDFPCWVSEGIRDTLRDIIVNKTIDPYVPVYDIKSCREWKGERTTPPNEEEIRAAPDRSCTSLNLQNRWAISYEEATAIGEDYAEAVLPANYATFWEIEKNIWDIFLIHHSFCEMDRFREEHPYDYHVQDCWYEAAMDTLCLGQLRPLLAFHRNNPHSILDLDLCNQILCLAQIAADKEDVTVEEAKQVEDVKLMLDLQQQIICRQHKFEAAELITKVSYLAEKYKYHGVVFELAQETANYFCAIGDIELARKAVSEWKPLFPDTLTCLNNLEYEGNRQRWFNNFEALLQRTGDQIRLPQPMTFWNTPGNDEYGLVSWGESSEVFFVRKDRKKRTVQIMTSKLINDTSWSKPVAVPALSISPDIVPVSMSDDGRLLILNIGGQLYQSYRSSLNRPWSKPDILPGTPTSNGWAWVSPDGEYLLFELYTDYPSLRYQPPKDIYYCQLDANGNYSFPKPAGQSINTEDFSEESPLMALGGRLLMFISDHQDGIGFSDRYSATLGASGRLDTTAHVVNLGLGGNTIFEDSGLTYYSDYTGWAYFDRLDQCSKDRDIWKIELEPEVFPQNTMRLAGLVLDENRKPIGGGFMEFTTDYNLRVHFRPVLKNGTYSYNSPEDATVVRLFPEIPGYYSEYETNHFLANYEKGSIIRDTFILTSFEYIRKHFKLEHSTFVNGTATFDNPNKTYPELTRFAKIATRMGAELDLIGHTDNTGVEASNHQLSLNRAQSVKQFLVEKCGFDPNRIRVFGYGPDKPLCSNDTEEGRRCNRRVEVIFRMPELTDNEK
ncbi:MAG TPA: OmpA family protein [Saprospiraceae bacterium]|nr:OmpA family protein [Saprospiraceae bacterium]HMQ81364.1 OmpA family protein [Saprospiraceae bacterium]